MTAPVIAALIAALYAAGATLTASVVADGVRGDRDELGESWLMVGFLALIWPVGLPLFLVLDRGA